ncbi:S-layer protein [Methanoregula sp.]|uniref:COG1361 S-layer family protein n=1 Tax=Methanoregula sp. TaxID=2052170 RepID=UPI0023741DC7|nr:S-layer protein [Methanoregula sp.]MDD1687396.1 S-layer protein [Methanoregula sp.]
MNVYRDNRNETMRIISTIVALGILFGLTVLLVPTALAADAPTVTITNYTVSPSVLMPDSLGTVTIMVKNTASSASVSEKSGKLAVDDYSVVKTTDINVNIENVHLEGNGISVLTKNYDQVGDIGPGQALMFTFTIQSPSKSGIYYPEIWIDTKGGTSVKYPFPVNVNTAVGIQKESILIMNSSLTGSVNPGDEIPVTLTITNAGQLLADDVTLTVTNVSGKLAPKTSDLYHVGLINPGEQKTVSLFLLSDKEADAGLVRVPVTIGYNSIDGTPLSQATGIDVILKGKAELGFVSVDTNPARLAEGTPFDLTIRIENTGTGEAKQVSGTVDMPAEGKKEAFIGKIKPGNDAPAIFLLEGMKGGNYPYNLTISYTDDMGVHTMTRQMNLRVSPADNSGNLILVLIILGILGFLAYRYWYLPKKNGDGKFPWERKN